MEPFSNHDISKAFETAKTIFIRCNNGEMNTVKKPR